MPDPSYYATIGRENGRRLRGAVRHNLRCFWRAVDRRGIERDDVRERADSYEDVLDGSTRHELGGLAETSGLDYRDLVAFNLFEESVQPDGCTVAIAVGEAAASGDTVFFKQSDKKGADEFEGEEYHEHQQINVIRIENPDDANKTVSVAAAGSTAVKMGINEAGVAIGSNISRTTTFDEEGTDSKDWAAASRGEYMRRALLHADTATEAAQLIVPELYAEPMSSPGNIDIADHERAVVIEGEFTHIATEWVEDDVVGRANKFEILKDLARSEAEIPSSYRRHERVMDFISSRRGEVTVEDLQSLSIDHTNGPGLRSICRHQEHGYTDETSLSAAIFEIDGDDPSKSEVFIALGKPCHAWRTESGDGWVRFTVDEAETVVPDRFLTGEAWLQHYTEEPYEGEAEIAQLID